MIETGEFHYLPDLSAEHKKILLNCPLKACNYEDLVWSNVIHSSIGVTIFLNWIISVWYFNFTRFDFWDVFKIKSVCMNLFLPLHNLYK